jgi:hypothetical protein
MKFTLTSPIHHKLIFGPNQITPNPHSLLSTPKGIARPAKSSNPSYVAFPTDTDINNNEKSASQPPMLPHARSSPVVVAQTSYCIPKLAN